MLLKLLQGGVVHIVFFIYRFVNTCHMSIKPQCQTGYLKCLSFFSEIDIVAKLTAMFVEIKAPVAVSRLIFLKKNALQDISTRSIPTTAANMPESVC